MLKMFVNGEQQIFKRWNFPGGEVGVQIIQKINPSDYFRIEISGIPSSDDVFGAMNLADALYRMNVPIRNINLYMPYLPYARQDRVCNDGESNAISVFIDILSMGHFGTIEVIDLHSNVSRDMLKTAFGAENVIETEQCIPAMNLPRFDNIVAPDNGARFKASMYDRVMIDGAKLTCLSKTRKDGKVLYNDLWQDTIQGTVCVVDDLCDGASTFISLAEMLTRTQPNITSLNLYCTHGLYSNPQNFIKLKEIYDVVYCHNLMNSSVSEDVVVI